MKTISPNHMLKAVMKKMTATIISIIVGAIENRM